MDESLRQERQTGLRAIRVSGRLLESVVEATTPASVKGKYPDYVGTRQYFYFMMGRQQCAVLPKPILLSHA